MEVSCKFVALEKTIIISQKCNSNLFDKQIVHTYYSLPNITSGAADQILRSGEGGHISDLILGGGHKTLFLTNPLKF